MFQFGAVPPRRLTVDQRIEIAIILKRWPGELGGFFRSLDEIITTHSLDAMPLIDPKRRNDAREQLATLRARTSALEEALKGTDDQLKLRLALGEIVNSIGPIVPGGDLPSRLTRLHQQLDAIDEGLTPGQGATARADHLRAIAYHCALAYRKHLGVEPAKRRDGSFVKVLQVIVAAAGFELPADPYNILRPAIDSLPPL